MATFQENNWKGVFGDEYNLRNPSNAEEMDNLYLKDYGISRSVLNEEFLGGSR